MDTMKKLFLLSMICFRHMAFSMESEERVPCKELQVDSD